MKIILIGAGNLATHLALELHRKGYQIPQIYSRTLASAQQLAQRIGAQPTDSITELTTDADLYLFSVKDDALVSLLKKMTPNQGLWVHTAGSVSIDIFAPFTPNYGSLYPLQTFSKSRPVDFKGIPIYIEAQQEKSLTLLQQVAQQLSDNVSQIDSVQRKQLHLAAVFACNFSNRMYAIAAQLLEEKGLSFNHLLPLIDETARKVHYMHPIDAQTGPAVRFDRTIIDAHLDALNDGDLKHLYFAISENIHSNSRR